MTSINSFRDLIALQKVMGMGLRVHRLAGLLPDHERFRLASSIQRGSILRASTLAEGYERGSTGDCFRVLKVAHGRLFELNTQLLYCIELT